MLFEPIAIISQACLFPGANNPEELWRLSCDKKDSFSLPDGKNWLIDPQFLLNTSAEYNSDRCSTIRGGYIKGFEQLFDPQGFKLPAESINSLDPMFHWVLHVARQAVQQTRYELQDLGKQKMGAILANLSYPNHSLIKLALSTWLKQQSPVWQALFDSQQLDWRNRFMSGLPAHILAQALDLQGPSYTLDAACGSTIYALKLACNALQTRQCDLMLTGGLNGMDELFMLMGFSNLHALSPSGQSLPLDQRADGLLPANGCGLFVLKRLQDAEQDNDKILGVIRGIGLSNDGHSGLLSPSIRGQVLAMQQAYQLADLDPASISFLECHATGTHLGDGIELQSLKAIFKDNPRLALGAIKANIGHALTASTAAALCRVLSALEYRQLPPIKQLDQPIEELVNSNFHLPLQAESWEEKDTPLRASINGFGMGGTNAHLIIEAWEGKTSSPPPLPVPTKPDIAIIALSVLAADCPSSEEFRQHLFNGKSVLKEDDGQLQGKIPQIALPLKLHATPNDLTDSQGQQLGILHSGLNAMEQVNKPILGEKTGIFVGMGCYPLSTTLRWLLEGLLVKNAIPYSKNWLDKALALFGASNAARVLGAMPNVLASRLALEWDCQGPCFAISSEELSGIRALEIACQALESGEIDMAIVAAVDMSCEAVHEQAAKAILIESKQVPGDAAVVLILKRLKDAQHDQESIYAIIGKENAQTSLELTETSYSHLFGHSHAASGLLQVAAAALAIQQRLLPPAVNKSLPIPWIPENTHCQAKISVNALGGQSSTVYLAAKEQTAPPFFRQPLPQIYCFSGDSRQALQQAITDHQLSTAGPARLVIIAENPEQLEHRRQIALKTLNNSQTQSTFNLPHQGIYYREQPLNGKIALVFATSNTFYPNMGIDISLAFPQLMPKIHEYYPKLQEVLQLLYGQTEFTKNYVHETWVTTYLSCLHYLITTEILGIKPQAVLGHSRGEAIALNILGIHRDLAAMNDYAINSGLFTDLLAGNYQALRQTYPELTAEQIGWENWRIGFDVEQAKAVIQAQPYCHLSIINTANDFVLSGIPQACQQVIQRLQPLAAAKLEMDFIVHCPELKAVGNIWRQMHNWPTYPQDLDFYSCITGRPYALTQESVADHMLLIGTEQLDFPQLIRNAYADGVRIFIEHGPQGLCSRWINEILQDQPHLATHYDQANRSSLTQLHFLVAELLVAGVQLNEQKGWKHV